MIVSFHQQFLLDVSEKVHLAGALGKGEHPVQAVAAPLHAADTQGLLGRKDEAKDTRRSSRKRLEIALR